MDDNQILRTNHRLLLEECNAKVKTMIALRLTQAVQAAYRDSSCKYQYNYIQLLYFTLY